MALPNSRIPDFNEFYKIEYILKFIMLMWVYSLQIIKLNNFANGKLSRIFWSGKKVSWKQFFVLFCFATTSYSYNLLGYLVWPLCFFPHFCLSSFPKRSPKVGLNNNNSHFNSWLKQRRDAETVDPDAKWTCFPMSAKHLVSWLCLQKYNLGACKWYIHSWMPHVSQDWLIGVCHQLWVTT